MVVQSFLNTLFKAICIFFNQLLKRGDTCCNPQGRSFRINLKCILEMEWPWVAHTNCLQQKWVKIQQKL